MTNTDQEVTVAHPAVGGTRFSASAPDSSLPFVMSVCAFGCAAAAIAVTSHARLLFDHLWLSGAVWAGAAALGFAAGWGLSRLFRFQRRTLTPKFAVISLVLAFAAVWGVNSIASHIFMSAWDRFDAELGGPGQCLAGTPYGKDRASVVTWAVEGDDRMEIWPGGPVPKGTPKGYKYPALKLKHAVNGGTRPLAPADSTSRDLLRSYGCR
ncbi:hypothetical protein [Streptomyces sp. ADI92-24]|uniref:hypothetical protein n=1 Tax=Streptomyces sp. ADI92-24 TaxID=1522756 RepID=UPI000F550001|nr:hypothetical protein [Streptomyces sp. ADI92-24]